MANENKTAPETENPKGEDKSAKPPGMVGTETVTAETLVEPLAGAMPEPTAGSEIPLEPEKPKDSRGVEFDPDKHKTRDDGSPATDKHGNYYSNKTGVYQRKGGRPPAQAPNPVRPKPTFAGAPAGTQPAAGITGEATPFNPNNDPVTDQYFLLADVYLQTGYGPLMLMMGAEIRPTTEEHLALRESLAAWLRSIRATEFSPGLAFTMTAAGVFISKFEKPTVREKAALTWLRLKQLWARFTGKKTETKTP